MPHPAEPDGSRRVAPEPGDDPTGERARSAASGGPVTDPVRAGRRTAGTPTSGGPRRLVRVPRVVLAVAGVVVLVWLTVPLELDGVVHWRRDAWLVVGAGALVTGIPGGLVEGALARWAHRAAVVVWLAVFGFFALWAPVLVSSRWVEGDGARLPTSGLGVAVLGWLLALGVEYGVARGVLALTARASGTRATAARGAA
ncbi:hypothetical protein [Cellulomonas cellasea]|uniref:Uncharacterized protein n=1 Tax=Cellulomonas cellasea TaxID=43670 RepID=A0A7W4UIH4_9CELL|nr:hypothetical protein [Cellulomonas cellasea]MBB2924439.1 hypothetical protein [Cellulomonas cellasea]